jgi:hypothetical protein
MTRKACILASILIGLALHAIPAAATTVTVNCNDKMTISKAIGFLNPLRAIPSA